MRDRLKKEKIANAYGCSHKGKEIGTIPAILFRVFFLSSDRVKIIMCPVCPDLFFQVQQHPLEMDQRRINEPSIIICRLTVDCQRTRQLDLFSIFYF